MRVNALLIRYEGGFREASSTGLTGTDGSPLTTPGGELLLGTSQGAGRIEGFVNYPEDSAVEADRKAASTISTLESARWQTTVGIEPTGSGDIPLTHWDVGDTITVPDQDGSPQVVPVIGLLLTEDEAGHPVYRPQVGERIPSLDERRATTNRNFSSGDLGGRDPQAQPRGAIGSGAFAARIAPAPIGGGRSGRPYLVAANNADPGVKAAADYVCDNTADQVEINAAITEAGWFGTSVMLSEGTFTLTGSIVLESYVPVVGTGMWSTYVNTAGTAISGVANSATSLTISDMTILSSNPVGKVGVHVDDDYIVIERCRLDNLGVGIRCGPGWQNEIRDNYFEGGTIGVEAVTSLTYANIYNNTFVGLGGACIDGTDAGLIGCTVIGNFARECYEAFFKADDLAQELVVESNSITGQKIDGGASLDPIIEITDASAAAGTESATLMLRVANNEIHIDDGSAVNDNQYAIYIDRAGTPTDQQDGPPMKISGNNCKRKGYVNGYAMVTDNLFVAGLTMDTASSGSLVANNWLGDSTSSTTTPGTLTDSSTTGVDKGPGNYLDGTWTP